MSKCSLEYTNMYIFVYKEKNYFSFYRKPENLKIFADKIAEKFCQDPETF